MHVNIVKGGGTRNSASAPFFFLLRKTSAHYCRKFAPELLKCQLGLLSISLVRKGVPFLKCSYRVNLNEFFWGGIVSFVVNLCLLPRQSIAQNRAGLSMLCKIWSKSEDVIHSPYTYLSRISDSLNPPSCLSDPEIYFSGWVMAPATSIKLWTPPRDTASWINLTFWNNKLRVRQAGFERYYQQQQQLCLWVVFI